MAFTEFFDDLNNLDKIDWEVMESKYWNDTPTLPDRKRRRQAEFLVKDFCPWNLFLKIGVVNSKMGIRVQKIVKNSMHQPVVQVHGDWYYQKEGIMIELTQGNMLEADVEALVNTVNCVGVMGKGIALQFKQAFRDNFQAYASACRKGQVLPGHMFVFPTGRMINPKYIINFPTKRHWKEKSKIEYIEQGLEALITEIKRLGIKTIAVPPLGCGYGGLKWPVVRNLIETAFDQLPDVQVLLFEPKGTPEPETMPIDTQKTSLTRARALLSDSWLSMPSPDTG